jgi:hypothetical protein
MPHETFIDPDEHRGIPDDVIDRFNSLMNDWDKELSIDKNWTREEQDEMYNYLIHNVSPEDADTSEFRQPFTTREDALSYIAEIGGAGVYFTIVEDVDDNGDVVGYDVYCTGDSDE